MAKSKKWKFPEIQTNKKVSFKFEYADAYRQFLADYDSDKYNRFSLYSGRGGGKSRAFHQLILEELEYGCIAVVRRYSNTNRGSVYNGVVKIINDLGMSSKYKCTTSPLLIVNRSTGYALQFFGLNDFQKTKSLEPHKSHFNLVVVEECQEMETREKVDEFIVSIQRGPSDNAKILYIWNPPPKKSHWTNTDLRKTIDDYMGAYYFTYMDLPVKWLGKKFIKEAEHIKNNNLKVYRYRYLGEPISAEDTIFTNIETRAITDKEIDKWKRDDNWIMCGLDFGFSPDPNAANEMYYDEDERILYIYREFHQGKLNNQQISDALEASGFDKDVMIIADNDEKDIRDLRYLGWTIRAAEKSNREAGFKWLQGLKAIVIDPYRCPYAAEEFTEYVYKLDREGSITGLFPEGQEDHHMSAVRYATRRIWKRGGY